MTLHARTTVYILTRNRTSLLRHSLNSVLAQNVPVNVVVSDNSQGTDTQEMLREEFPFVARVWRNPPLSAHEHFKAVLSEADTEFLVMFHDDDVMLPNFVRTMQSRLMSDSLAVAAACNAGKLKMEKLAQGSVMGNFKQLHRLLLPQDMLEYYFRKGEIGPAPFPGYMYRTVATRGLSLDRQHGGKYSDVSFLLKLLERGPIVWLPDVLMHYRYHDANDSGTPAMNDAASLVRFVGQRYELSRNCMLVKEFRLRCWLQWLLYLRQHPELAARYPWRRSLVTRALVRGMSRLAFQRPQLLWLGMHRLLAAIRSKLLP